VTLTGFRWARPISMIVALAVMSSCGLPQAGPNKRQIYQGSVQKDGDAFIVSVNDRVTRATAVTEALGFSEGFKNASTLGSDTIRPAIY
jgi:polysaccharide export outer membrane protein